MGRVEPAHGIAAGVEVLDRVVVHREPLQGAVGPDGHVVVARVAHEVLEGLVRVAAIDLVVQVHAEPAGRVAEDPDLGVLALRTLGMIPVLGLEPLGDPVRVPLEGLVAVAGDVERLGPLVVAGDVLVGREQ
jgi:hypothetical protein